MTKKVQIQHTLISQPSHFVYFALIFMRNLARRPFHYNKKIIGKTVGVFTIDLAEFDTEITNCDTSFKKFQRFFDSSCFCAISNFDDFVNSWNFELKEKRKIRRNCLMM